MDISSILITSDDGYNSAGVRLLAHLFKDKYELFITGTKTQQSGVGGKISYKKGFAWGLTTVDGVPALWVDGTPNDSVGVAVSYFERSFDVVISGINLGANLGTALFSSGTCNAALRALATQLAPRAMAVSWDLPAEFHLRDHQESDSIKEYLDYPGQAFEHVFQLAIDHDFWQVPLLNINFPSQPTSELKMTKMSSRIQDVWTYTNRLTAHDQQGGQFVYSGDRITKLQLPAEYDAQAVQDGFISVTPCKYDINADQVVAQVAGTIFKLR